MLQNLLEHWDHVGSTHSCFGGAVFKSWPKYFFDPSQLLQKTAWTLNWATTTSFKSLPIHYSLPDYLLLSDLCC